MKARTKLRPKLLYRINAGCRTKIAVLMFVGSVAFCGTASAMLPPVGPGEPNPNQEKIVSDGAGGWEIYPTGLPEELKDPADPDGLALLTNPTDGSGGYMTADSLNIQWALNNAADGAMVRLKHVSGIPFYFPATAPGVSFNVRAGAPFGTPSVSKGCAISGEKDSDGNPLTVIEGGVALFSLTAETQGKTIVLQDIVFNNAITHVAGSQPQHLGNTIIDNCVVSKLKHAEAMKYTWTIGFWSFQAGGEFTVKNSVIDIPDEAPPWIPGPDGSHPNSPGLAVKAISLPYVFPFPRSVKVNITGNTIRINASLYSYENPPPPTGLESLAGLTGIHIVANEGETNILNNTVTCRPVGITLDRTQNAMVSGNTVSFPMFVNLSLDDLPEGIAPDYAYNYAVRITGGSHDNTFIGNDVSGFSPSSPKAGIAAQVAILGESRDNKFYGNTFGSARDAQVYVDSSSYGNYFGPDDPEGVTGNIFGATEMFGLVIEGRTNRFVENTFGASLNRTVPCVIATGSASGNEFTNNDFTGTGLKGFLYKMRSRNWIRAGNILLDKETSGNFARVYSHNFAPGDRCSQVADLAYYSESNDGHNKITYEDYSCTPRKQRHLIHMLGQGLKYQRLKAGVEAMHDMQ